MGLELRWGAATDPGRVRVVNEDTAYAEDGLWIVADGMGGHAAGEVASQTAVETVRAHAPEAGLAEAVRLANRAVLERAEAEVGLRGMGTTMTAAAPVEIDGVTQIVVVNVGDSRAYLFRDGELLQLTEDHSLVAELEREGRITAAEARVHPQRNIVTRVLGNEPEVLVDAFPLDPFRGDRLLLCSDGLFNEVDDHDIADALGRLHDPAAAAGALVDLANQAGGRDNITVVIVDVVDDGDKAAVASALLAAKAVPSRATPTAGGDVEDGDVEGGGGGGRWRRSSGPTPGTGVGPRWLTWRTAAFVGAVVAVLAVAVGGTWWVARSTYYVGLDGDEVVIYRGRPGGVLLFDPTVEEPTELTIEDVPASDLSELEEGKKMATLGDAQRYVETLRAGGTGSTSTTTTSTTTTSTTTTSTTTTTPVTLTGRT